METRSKDDVKGSPIYDFVRWGVPVKEDTYPESSAQGPVSFLDAFDLSMLPPGIHLLLGG